MAAQSPPQPQQAQPQQLQQPQQQQGGWICVPCNSNSSGSSHSNHSSHSNQTSRPRTLRQHIPWRRADEENTTRVYHGTQNHPTCGCDDSGGFAFHDALVYCRLRRHASMTCVVLTCLRGKSGGRGCRGCCSSWMERKSTHPVAAIAWVDLRSMTHCGGLGCCGCCGCCCGCRACGCRGCCGGWGCCACRACH